MSTSWSPRVDEDLRQSNQRDRVREILRSAGAEGVCTFQWNALGLVNARNRISELRDPEGDYRLDITSVACDLEKYHAEELRDARRGRGQEPAPHSRYVWRWKDPKPLQPRLLSD